MVAGPPPKRAKRKPSPRAGGSTKIAKRNVARANLQKMADAQLATPRKATTTSAAARKKATAKVRNAMTRSKTQTAAMRLAKGTKRKY